MQEKIYVIEINNNQNYLISLSSDKIICSISILEDPKFGILQINEKNKSFNYFNDVLNQISIKIISETIVNIIASINDIVIKQIYIAEHLDHFANDINESYPQLIPYCNDYEPAIFYGIWSENDYKVITNNKSLKIIIWTGGDINIVDNNILKKRIINRIKYLNKTKHIAISSFIQKDLIKLGMKFYRVPFMGIEFEKYKPTIKGPCIYVYTSPVNGDKYGEYIYSRLVQKYNNIKFIFTCSQQGYQNSKKKKNIYGIKYYNKSYLINEIYPKCFLGLRLTSHDGLAASVQELGVMGIKSIHNGDSPSCLNYNSFEDICNHIDNEIKTIGTMDEKLANDVKNYLTFDPKFFNTEFFKLI